MTIVAFASGAQSLPNETPPASYTEASDPVVNVAALSTNVNLYGNATDSADASPVFTYQWSILSQTHQSPQVSFASSTAQNPVIQAVNSWGNIRCFLVVTNQNSGATSETDPLRAPDSAFTTVRVKSTSAVIQKIAAGERNWHNDADAWAQAIENLAAGNQGLPDHTITQHTDVIDATGADLEALSSGGYANDPDNAANPLHKHSGTHIDAATNGVRGTVTIESAAGPAKAINIERLILTASIMWTRLDNGQIVPMIAPITLENDAAIPSSANLVTWKLEQNVKVQELHITLADGGTNAPADHGGQYLFDLVAGTSADFVANTMARLNVNATGAPAVAHQPLFLTKNGINVGLGDKLLGLICIAGPTKTRDVMGSNLTATVVLTREAA